MNSTNAVEMVPMGRSLQRTSKNEQERYEDILSALQETPTLPSQQLNRKNVTLQGLSPTQTQKLSKTISSITVLLWTSVLISSILLIGIIPFYLVTLLFLVGIILSTVATLGISPIIEYSKDLESRIDDGIKKEDVESLQNLLADPTNRFFIKHTNFFDRFTASFMLGVSQALENKNFEMATTLSSYLSKGELTIVYENIPDEQVSLKRAFYQAYFG